MKKILICPMDWGLGHATRCIPIINELLKRKCEVVIASSGDALALLKLEFPLVTCLTLPGYNPSYTRSSGFFWKMLLQLPRFMRTIEKEHHEVEAIVKSNNIDIIISDNRYGCFSAQIPSVIISHQLSVRVPFFSSIVNQLISRHLKRFSACWVPDSAGDNSLAGDLAVTNELEVVHIGYLSRMKAMQLPEAYDLMGIVSGPEPQRTIFEKTLVKAFRDSGKRTLIVKGLPGAASEHLEENSTEINHLSSEELNIAIAKSGVIVSRPGYSTVMDLATMGKKAIFVPTPGQTEQEYLGRNLMAKGIAESVSQNDFNLNDAVQRISSYSGFKTTVPGDLLTKALNSLLK